MGSLSQEANSVVRAGPKPRSDLTGTDRERLEAALGARLGMARAPFFRTLQPAPAARLAGWRFVAGATVGVCVVGGALLFGLRTQPSAPPERRVEPQASRAAAPIVVAPPAVVELLPTQTDVGFYGCTGESIRFCSVATTRYAFARGRFDVTGDQRARRGSGERGPNRAQRTPAPVSPRYPGHRAARRQSPGTLLFGSAHRRPRGACTPVTAITCRKSREAGLRLSRN